LGHRKIAPGCLLGLGSDPSRSLIRRTSRELIRSQAEELPVAANGPKEFNNMALYIVQLRP
jgi:hypothetical protein